MRKQLSAFLLLLSLNGSIFGQEISRQEADSLLRYASKWRTEPVGLDPLLKIARFFIFKPGEYKADLDSAESFINDAKRLYAATRSKEPNGQILLVESYLFKERGQGDTAKKMVENAIRILKDENARPSLLGEAYLELSYYYTYYDAPDKKTNLVEQALGAYRQAGSPERTAFCLTLLADLHIGVDKNAQALDELKLALRLYDSIHYRKTQGIYVLLARFYGRYADFSDAIRYDLMALKAAEAVHDSTMTTAQIYNTLGSFFSIQGEHEKALTFLRKGLDIAERYSDTLSLLVFALSISDVSLNANRPKDALEIADRIEKKYGLHAAPSAAIYIAMMDVDLFTRTKQYARALPYSIKLLYLANAPDFNAHDKIAIYGLVIKYYIASGQYAAAENYLTKNKALARQLGTATDISSNFHGWYLLDSAQHKYASALYNLREYEKIRDSLYSGSKSKEIQLLQMEFETEKKDQNILLLNQKEKLQENDLGRLAQIRNLSFGGVLLLLLVMTLLYRQYRLKQRANKEINLKNGALQHLLSEKEWLVKEIHHRVKNNLQTITSLLESQSELLSGEALQAIQGSQNRVYAMSLIHQKLYLQTNTASVNMQMYLAELVDHLKESYGIRGKIRFRLDIAPVGLEVSQAIPLALILNEAITNAIKYAFTGNPSPENEIAISMRRLQDNFINFSVADNGRGWSPDAGQPVKKGLGFELMTGLTEDLKGTISVDYNSGVTVSINFPVYRPYAADNIETAQPDQAYEREDPDSGG